MKKEIQALKMLVGLDSIKEDLKCVKYGSCLTSVTHHGMSESADPEEIVERYKVLLSVGGEKIERICTAAAYTIISETRLGKSTRSE